MPTVPSLPNSKNPLRLQSRAYTELRRLIASGEIPPGTFLSERQLAQQLEMSKTPVHVALERLESEGFVTISAQQGVVVRGMSVEDIVNHYELREAIETYVMKRLAGQLGRPQADALRKNLREQGKAARGADVMLFMGLDAGFHLLLASFLGNQQITSAMAQLRDKIHQVALRVFSVDRNRMRESFVEHQGIVQALLDGDPVRAAELVTGHLDAGRRRILIPARVLQA